MENIPEMNNQDFIHDDIEYKWMSFEEMLKDESIISNNNDVIAFVMSSL